MNIKERKKNEKVAKIIGIKCKTFEYHDFIHLWLEGPEERTGADLCDPFTRSLDTCVFFEKWMMDIDPDGAFVFTEYALMLSGWEQSTQEDFRPIHLATILRATPAQHVDVFLKLMENISKKIKLTAPAFKKVKRS